MHIMKTYERVLFGISKSELVMDGPLHIVILKHSGKHAPKLLLIRQLATDGILSLMQLGCRDHLHRGSYLQSAFYRSDSGLYFL